MADEQISSNDPLPSHGDGSDHSKANRRTYSLVAVVLVLGSPFLIDAPAFALPYDFISDSIIVPIFAGLVTAKLGLLATWLAWGGLRFIFRMLIVTLSLCFTLQLKTNPLGQWPQDFLFLYLLLMVCAVVIAAPRMWGVRWVTRWNDLGGASMPTRKSYQFSIEDVLEWTTAVAFLAVLFRWIGLPKYEFWDPFFILLYWIVLIAIGVLTAMWAELTTKPNVAARVAVTLGITLLIATFSVALFQAQAHTVPYVFILFLMTEDCLLGCFYFMRRLGHRLVWHKS
jgi:hypothetical protein